LLPAADDKDKSRVLNACKLGDRCEIKGIIRGHGTFGWVEITSVMALTHAAQLPEAYLGDWSSDVGITPHQHALIRRQSVGALFIG
jgi:hypothetical protein